MFPKTFKVSLDSAITVLALFDLMVFLRICSFRSPALSGPSQKNTRRAPVSCNSLKNLSNLCCSIWKRPKYCLSLVNAFKFFRLITIRVSFRRVLQDFDHYLMIYSINLLLYLLNCSFDVDSSLVIVQFLFENLVNSFDRHIKQTK